MLGTCRLCKETAELQDSHIIPGFVAKWLKETSATGYIRFGQFPNKRVQDSYKRYWLCQNCERRLNVWETNFANQIFYPLNEDGGKRINYGPWLLKFCVSISWRTLLFMKEEKFIDDFTTKQIESVDSALNTWADFLLDKIPHPKRFEQHFLPLDAIAEPSRLQLPANINRYILRTIDMDVVQNSTTLFTVCKMSKHFVFGFVDVQNPKQWVGTKVHANSGIVGQGKFVLPRQLADYLRTEAERFATVYSSISETQQSKINAKMWNDIDRVAKSGSFEAMRHDVNLFGRDAFDIHRSKKKEE